MIEFCVFQAAPKAYLGMVWNIFFVSKGRGIDLETHFPWINLPSADRWYVIAMDGNSVVGGLCVQESTESASRIGSVGLVCVHPTYRGSGISSKLLKLTLIESRFRDLAALRLWTRTHDVYRKLGFVAADISLYGWIRKPLIQSGNIVAFTETILWQSQPRVSAIGLPPFARSGREWRSADATVLAIDDGDGPIVAEWVGAATDVATLLECVLPATARLNALAGDDLIDVLGRLGWNCMLAASSLQMMAPLKSNIDPSEWAQRHTPRILHRI